MTHSQGFGYASIRRRAADRNKGSPSKSRIHDWLRLAGPAVLSRRTGLDSVTWGLESRDGSRQDVRSFGGGGRADREGASGEKALDGPYGRSARAPAHRR